MNIKNISQLRFIIKEQEDLLNRNENFMGHSRTAPQSNNKEFGFFSILHGKKENIAGFIQPQLQNAEDEQAIYEFVQNAADSTASNIAVLYDENYFMVVNNGRPFNLNDTIAIINAFQSTKSDKDDEVNCGKIGRYGIGFKLVHRLVGKEEGAKELLEDYKGPIVFSWHNKEQFEALENYSVDNKPQLGDCNESLSAWLFKILITCFPVHPEEEVLDIHYNKRTPFSTQEVEKMAQFLQKHKEPLSKMDLSQGSMFFIEFGENKKEKLDESVDNLRTGLKYALNTLNKLDRVIINYEVVEQIPIKKETFSLPVGSEAFKEIAPEYEACPIEITFGYPQRQEEQEVLKKSPNFYQYFPMGDEVHGLSFMIHSTSFIKETNRRKLSEQSSINRKTLGYFVEHLVQRMRQYAQDDWERYLEIFGVLLTSDIVQGSSQSNAGLIKQYLSTPILTAIKGIVPTQGKQLCNASHVRLKNTDLNITPEQAGIAHAQWFAWLKNDNQKIRNAARDSSKLNIPYWGIQEILLEGQVPSLNTWIAQLEIKEYDLLVEELTEIRGHQWAQSGTLFNKFIQLDYLEFSSQEFKSLKSLKEAKTHLVLNKFLADNQELLKKLGFKVSKQVIGDQSGLGKEIHAYLPYLNSGKTLFNIVQQQLLNTYPSLSDADKAKVFTFLHEALGTQKAPLKELCLFKNQEEKLLPLKELLPQGKYPSWLNSYVISTKQSIAHIEGFLMPENEVYTKVLRPNWDNLTAKVVDDDIAMFYSKVVSLYEKANQQTSLSDKASIYIGGGQYVNNKDVFYAKELSGLSQQDYNQLKQVVESVSDKYLPDQRILKFIFMTNSSPFRVEKQSLKKLYIDSDRLISSEDAKALIEFTHLQEDQFFQHFVIKQVSGGVTISIQKSAYHQYVAKEEDNLLEDLISRHLSDRLIPLPAALSAYATASGILRGSELYRRVFESISINQHLEEACLIANQSERKGIQELFLNKLQAVFIPYQETYSKTGWIGMLLDMAIHVLDDYTLFREKLRIAKADKGYIRPEEASAKDQLSLGEYKLSLSQLAIYDNRDAELLESFMEKFPHLPTSKLRSLLGIDQELGIEKVYENLKGVTLQDGQYQIKNAEQFAFLLIAEQQGLILVDWALFCLKTRSEKWRKVSWLFGNISYSLQDFPFIHENLILSEDYDRLQNLLKLDKSNRVWGFNNGKCSLFLAPMISKSGISMPNFHTDRPNARTAFLDFLYLEWDHRDEYKKTDFAEPHNREKLGEFLGCSLKQVVEAPDKWLLEEEKLPKYMSRWMAQDAGRRVHFLSQALGITNSDSPRIQLRKYLLENVNTLQKEPLRGYLKELHNDEIKSSLQWLSKQDQVLGEDVLIMYEYVVLDISMPVPRVVSYQNQQFQVSLAEIDQGVYKLEANDIEEFKKEVILEKVIEIANELDLLIFPASLMSGEWKTISGKPVEIVTRLEVERLRNASQKYDKYESWEQQTGYQLYAHQGLLPESYFFQDRKIGESVRLHIWEKDQQIFFNSEEELDIFHLVQKALSNKAPQVWKLFEDAHEKLKDLAFTKYDEAQRKIEELERELKEVKQQHTKAEELSQTYGDPQQRKQRPTSIETDAQKSLSSEAKNTVKAKLDTLGYDTENWSEEYSIVHGVKYEGEEIPIVVKSAKKGAMYINPNDWLVLSKNATAQLWVVVSGGKAINVTLQDVEAANQQFFMQFDIPEFQTKGIEAFAELFRYTQHKTHFIFDHPSVTANSEYMQPFGLFQRKEGEVTAQPRNLKD